MSKINYKENIVQLIKKSQFGLNIKNIADELGYSRTTITKYLQILEKEGLVIERAVGQYKIWVHRDALLETNRITPVNEMIFSILKHIQTELDPISLKKLGQAVAGDMNFSRYIDQEIIKKSEEKLEYEGIAELLMKTIDSICKIYDDYNWHLPIINIQKGIIILRMSESDLLEIPSYFHLISGIIEYEMNRFIPESANVNVIQINENNKVVDLEFEIKRN